MLFKGVNQHASESDNESTWNYSNASVIACMKIS